MCFNLTTDQENAVREVVDVLVSNGEMFTAHDVTVRVREKVGPNEHIAHEDVRGLIREMWGNLEIGDSYRCEFSQFSIPNGVTVGALVYLPPTAQASDYDPARHRGGADPVPTNPAPSQPKDNDTLYPDSRGRLLIPAATMSKLGVQPSDRVMVGRNTQGQAVVVNHTNNLVQHAAQYTVDAHRDVRINSKALQSVGLAITKFKVQQDSITGDLVVTNV